MLFAPTLVEQVVVDLNFCIKTAQRSVVNQEVLVGGSITSNLVEDVVGNDYREVWPYGIVFSGGSLPGDIEQVVTVEVLNDVLAEQQAVALVVGSIREFD